MAVSVVHRAICRCIGHEGYLFLLKCFGGASSAIKAPT
jgi:hypothetical protein